MDLYNVLGLILFAGIWFALVRYILPRLGVPT